MERVANIRQCGHGSYHINQLFGVIEVLDEKGEPVSPGRSGRIVGAGVELKIVFVDRIELTEEGKFKWVRSEIASP